MKVCHCFGKPDDHFLGIGFRGLAYGPASAASGRGEHGALSDIEVQTPHKFLEFRPDRGRNALAPIRQDMNVRGLVTTRTEGQVDGVPRVLVPQHHNRFTDVSTGAEIPAHGQLVLRPEGLAESDELLGYTASKRINRLVRIANDFDCHTCVPQPFDNVEVGRVAILGLVDDQLAESCR